MTHRPVSLLIHLLRFEFFKIPAFFESLISVASIFLQEIGDSKAQKCIVPKELVESTLQAVTAALDQVEGFMGEKATGVPSPRSPTLVLGALTPVAVSPKSPGVDQFALVPFVGPQKSLSPPSKVLGARAKVKIQKAPEKQDAAGGKKTAKAKALAKTAKAKALADRTKAREMLKQARQKLWQRAPRQKQRQKQPRQTLWQRVQLLQRNRKSPNVQLVPWKMFLRVPRLWMMNRRP